MKFHWDILGESSLLIPFFFNTYNYILSENGLFLCHISGYVLFLCLHVEVSNIKHCIRKYTHFEICDDPSN